MVYQSTTHQPDALKSGGSFARLADVFCHASLTTLHERLRLAFLFAPPPMDGES